MGIEISVKKFFVTVILMLSFNAVAQEEKVQVEDIQKKKLMVKQIEIIKTIKKELKKLMK